MQATAVQSALLRKYSAAMLSVLLGLVLYLHGVAPAAAAEPVKVVYHMADGINQATRGLANIRNHLRGDPEAKIVVVALGEGVRFLLQDATDSNGKPFAGAVQALAAQGVDFRICNNTLSAHRIPLEQVLPQANLVPAGVVEVARLQAREGYVYLRP